MGYFPGFAASLFWDIGSDFRVSLSPFCEVEKRNISLSMQGSLRGVDGRKLDYSGCKLFQQGASK